MYHISPCFLSPLWQRRTCFLARRMSPNRFSISIIAILSSFLSWEVAVGDVFQLRDGGHVEGVLSDRGSNGEYVIRTTEGALVTFERKQIRRTVQIKDDLLEYQQRSRSLPDTVEAHHRLAEWCSKNRLSRQRKQHLQRVLELEPNDEIARSSLGYQKYKGRWLTRDEIMKDRGLVYYENDYRTTQEIAIRKRSQARENVEADWYKNLRLWRRWLDKRDPQDRAEALTNIQAVSDPAAASSFIKLLEREDDEEIRRLYISVMGELNSAAAVQKLVEISVYDSLPENRQLSLDYLLRHPQPISVTPYTKALKSRDNEIILRAAEALERIGDPEAISPLIDALVTTHKFINPNANPGQMSASFDPSGNGGGGLAMGGKPKVTKRVRRNSEVRRALVELSGGQDFEYDSAAWRRWYVNTQIHDNVDTRRDE